MSNESQPEPTCVTPAPIAVLGMHRSGTSCLTGLLEDAGVWLGNVSKKNPHNLKGNQENALVMQLHNKVLSDNDSTWDQPPDGDCIWLPEASERLRQIIGAYPKDRTWAMKDPRACFTISGWRDQLPELRFVGTFRHPLAVAASLMARAPAKSLDHCLTLWCQYNERLLKLREKWGFPLVCFDFHPDEYLECVSRAFSLLDLKLDLQNTSFFDVRLRRQIVDTSQPVPEPVLNIYQELLAD